VKYPKDKAKILVAAQDDGDYNEHIARTVMELWEMQSLQEVFQRRHQTPHIQILSTAPYFFTHALRFAGEAYKANDQDALMAKLHTTGLVETQFTMHGLDFTVIDVGGQRSERRKWLHCFTEVSAVIYFVALDEYPMTLEEDNETNRFEESIRLFTDVVGSPWFVDNLCILFLNKMDLMPDTIKRYPLDVFFKDFNKADAKDVEKSIEFLKSKYVGNYVGKNIATHPTCAIDPENVLKVFTSIRDRILEHNMECL